MFKWDSTNEILTDYMGMPLSRTEAQELRKLINKHLKKSPADLAELGNIVYKRSMPSMHRDEPLPSSDFV